MNNAAVSSNTSAIMAVIRALLNLMCVALSMVCKVPQLRFHITSRSTQVTDHCLKRPWVDYLNQNCRTI